MQAVKFENVCFHYGDKSNDTERISVLNNLNFEIEKGSFNAILGRNGSGKSTVAKLINGLLLPKEGKVEVLGFNTLDGANLFSIRKNVGMVFQNPDNQQIASIVEDDVAFGPENIGMPREEIKERIDYALKVTDMEKYREYEVARLSGGQKQRVAIAGAIAINPQILILDESTSMLDPKGRSEVIEVAKTLNRENGITVIDITHYMDEAVNADKIYLLDNGRIVKSGTPKEVFGDVDTLKTCGLELPFPSKIAEKLKAKGIPDMDGILRKEELLDRLCKLLQKN